MNIEGYRVMKEEQFYFIVVDRARPRNWGHTLNSNELNSKLEELSRECSPAKEVHRFSTESDTAAPYKPTDKEREASQIVSSPDAVFLADDVSISKGDQALEKLSRSLGFKPVECTSKRSSESPETKPGPPQGRKSAVSLLETVEAIERDSLRDCGPESQVTIKSCSSMVNVQPTTSCPIITAPSPEQGGLLKRSSSFSGFTMEGQAVPLDTTPERVANGCDSPDSMLKSVASAPQMVLHSRVRHFSGPSGPGTPLSRTSTRPQTPSWVSSTGSYTEGGIVFFLSLIFNEDYLFFLLVVT